MKRLIYTLLIFCSFIYTHQVLSQGFPGGGAGGGDRIDGKFKFVPIPYIDYHRALGFTFGAIPVGMMNLSEKDTISPSSTVGLLGMYSENKTWFAMGFGMFYLNEDKWRLKFAAGVGDVNFQYYLSAPVDQWFRYNTNADFAYISGQRKVAPHLYIGAHYIYTTFKTNSEIFTDSTATELHGIGLELDYDRRSNVSYPRSGYYLEGEVRTYPSGIANQPGSNRLTFAYNHYYSTRKNTDVVATRFYAGVNLGNVNFNQQFIVGQTDIRGYSFGQFRGDALLAAQGEYRWNFHERFGLVGFAGLATVFGSNNESDNGRLLPGIGGGLRYVFIKETHSTVGFDVAAGDGDWGFYFRFTEAF